ncbi:DUF6428 family protein [Neorhizobium sp. DAR64862/K0K3]|uniref:DUF6428 family protein n=1 Tax=Neorhizobium sp. DAR64862/K0K3 TaxID=3421957 RepID=UPI003D2CFF53
MNAIDKSLLELDISLGRLLDTIDGARDVPLIISYDGRPVKPGYHVTDVKAGQFAALDCGANPEAWSEIFLQQWDIEEGDRTHMPAGKFAAIIRKVSEHVKLDGSAKLTFEVSDGIRPMQLYCGSMPRLRDGALHVELAPHPASCKPRDRWLEQENRKTTQVCRGLSAAENTCCG